MPATAALVRLADSPSALLRVVSACHKRGWHVAAARATTTATGLDVALRLSGPRCEPAAVMAQLERLVVGSRVVVAVRDDTRLPDHVALAVA